MVISAVLESMRSGAHSWCWKNARYPFISHKQALQPMLEAVLFFHIDPYHWSPHQREGTTKSCLNTLEAKAGCHIWNSDPHYLTICPTLTSEWKPTRHRNIMTLGLQTSEQTLTCLIWSRASVCLCLVQHLPGASMYARWIVTLSGIGGH